MALAREITKDEVEHIVGVCAANTISVLLHQYRRCGFHIQDARGLELFGQPFPLEEWLLRLLSKIFLMLLLKMQLMITSVGIHSLHT